MTLYIILFVLATCVLMLLTIPFAMLLAENIFARAGQAL